MAPSLILNVTNLMEPVMFSENKFKEIGSCYISPSQCRIVKGIPGELSGAEPQYYTIIGPSGSIQGKILMMVAFSKNLKESIQPDDFKREFDLKFEKYKLDFSCIGLRNLDTKCPSPTITVRIPSYQLLLSFKPTIKISEFEEQELKLKIRRQNLPDQKKKIETSQKLFQTEVVVSQDRGKPIRYGEELLYLYVEPNTESYISSLIP